MVKAIDLVKPIEEFAPVFMQEGWDNCGFSIGDVNTFVNKALIALDCTESVIDEAIELGANIIITHHPLIFGGVKKIMPSTEQGRIIIKAITHNILIYSAHTNADKAVGGVSSIMAEKLNLQNVSPLTPDGFGVVGNLVEPLSGENLIKLVKEKFNIDILRSSSPIKNLIKSVAVCGGSGKSFIKNAMDSGAQVYITGDISYHDFYCEKDFMLMDIGHYYSEYDIVHLFKDIICKNFPNFATLISEKNNNPIYYY